MSECQFKINLETLDGQQEAPISLEDYKEAFDNGLTFSQHINRKFLTDAGKHGTAFAQCMARTGMMLSDDKNYGIRPPSMYDLVEGKAQLNAAVVAPDGQDRFTPAGRLFFPAVMLDMIDSSLRDNRESYNGAILSMVAQTVSINSPRYDQVVIDFTRPRAARGKQIAQLAEPARMLTFTTSSTQKTMPVLSLGIEFSDQAIKAASIDIIGLSLREHAIEERAAQLEGDLVAIVQGDVDAGEAGIIGSAVTAESLDATGISANGTLTQKAWIKFLRSGWRKRTISHVICDLDTYLAIEGRAGRPVKEHEPAQDERLNTMPNVMLPGIPGGVQIFITETSLLGANTIVGLDSSKAIRRMVYVGANYNAIQNWVMRRSTAMRFDWSERLETLGYADAFSVMTLTGAS